MTTTTLKRTAWALALVLGCSSTDDGGGGGTGGGTGGSGGGTGGTGGGPAVECDGNCHYVRADADEGGDGATWASALTELPDPLERGQIYYLADGDYPGRDFAAPEQGDSPIYLFKATESHHGTDEGWQPAYGDETAQLGPITFSTSHWSLDGLMGSGKGGYGFTIRSGDCAGQVKLIRLEEGVSDITVRHVDLGLCGDVNEGQDIIYGAAGASDITVARSYLHDVARCPFLMRGWQDVVIEHNVIENAGNSHGIHMEGISDIDSQNVTVRHNLWENIAGTGIIILGDVSGYAIYGNVFLVTDPSFTIGGNGAIGTWTGNFANDTVIYNNSFVGIVGLNAGIFMDSGTGNEAYNNLWYDCAANQIGLGNVDHDYNWFAENWRVDHEPHIDLDEDLAASEPNGQLGGGDPFVDRDGGNWHLAAPTEPGRELGAPYDTDPSGEPRGQDGTWDRGAFEQVSP
ncbi:MAG: right-handed parallel beta-helix repeat-containing protein [Deltaproteobacteria bacterium]|nr:right-handed parallel beta-helix repeat-containing protein [Deltaproteobacteria bacterium]